MKEEFALALKDSHTFRCLECGKCTTVCPVSAYNGNFSPRRTISNLLASVDLEECADHLLWTCLTCGLCSYRCPVKVDYNSLMKKVRAAVYSPKAEELFSHGGALQAVMQLMCAPKINQNRLEWIPKDARYSTEKGEVLYFVGCLPYFDAFFEDINVESTQIARQTVKLLNTLDIEPVILPDERCCGHDLLWTGDVDSFKKLNAINLELIKNSGAKTVVTSCAECYRTLLYDVPEYVGSLDVEVIHITQFLHRRLSQLKTNFVSSNPMSVTYQDPCRLGRHADVYIEPRELLEALPNLDLLEMDRSGKRSICCGTSAWTRCDSCSKQIQMDRLREARQTGADLLVTACPKCYVHFTCAQSEKNLPDEKKIIIRDITDVLASFLE